MRGSFIAGCATGCEAASTSTWDSGSGLPGGASLGGGSRSDASAEDGWWVGMLLFALQSADMWVLRWCGESVDTALTSAE